MFIIIFRNKIGVFICDKCTFHKEFRQMVGRWSKRTFSYYKYFLIFQLNVNKFVLTTSNRVFNASYAFCPHGNKTKGNIYNRVAAYFTILAYYINNFFKPKRLQNFSYLHICVNCYVGWAAFTTLLTSWVCLWCILMHYKETKLDLTMNTLCIAKTIAQFISKMTN